MVSYRTYDGCTVLVGAVKLRSATRDAPLEGVVGDAISYTDYGGHSVQRSAENHSALLSFYSAIDMFRNRRRHADDKENNKATYQLENTSVTCTNTNALHTYLDRACPLT
jgi:hypothetical protein